MSRLNSHTQMAMRAKLISVLYICLFVLGWLILAPIVSCLFGAVKLIFVQVFFDFFYFAVYNIVSDVV